MVSRTLSLPVLLLAVPVLSYLAICAVLFFRQGKMIFFPRQYAPGEYDARARAVGFEPWRDAAGASIGWKKTRDDAVVSILCLHGNGSLAADRWELSGLLADGPPANFFLLEFPGYGDRPGRPSERSLTMAAVEAVDNLRSSSSLPIWLLGESLGTGVATGAAAQRPDAVSGLVLVTPFDSIAGAAAIHYPWLPVDALVRHRFDSTKNVQNFSGPVALVLASLDTTTPPHLGERLATFVPGANRVWMVEDAGHNDSHMLLENWPEIALWLQNETTRKTGSANP